MKGKTVLITGASSGIGLEAAVRIASLGASVVLTARDTLKADAAQAEVRRRSGSAEVGAMICDLSSLAATRALALEFRETHPRLDVLVNNAGTVSPSRVMTADGLELTFAVNHLAHFLLTNLLLDLLRASGPARIVNVSSIAHRNATMDFDNLQFERGGYTLLRAYSRSKLANVLFTRELARRLGDSAVTANCLHPGAVSTNIWSHASWYLQPFLQLGRLLMISPATGGETIVHLATSPEVAGRSGGYYEKKQRVAPSALADDPGVAKRLWEESERLVHRAA
jgi:NAD(P)-dependent dehydrogenase (short-subunit alcohol dehydrogenase family)